MDERATSDIVRDQLKRVKTKSVFFLFGIFIFVYLYLIDFRILPELLPYWVTILYTISGIVVLTSFIVDGYRDYREGKKILRSLGYNA